MGDNLISIVVTLYYFKCPGFKTKHYEKSKNLKAAHTRRKKPTETLSEEAEELLDKNFKSAILNVFKELKETMYNGKKESIMRIFY